MRGSLPGEKTLMWGTCWVSICTTPAINHNFKDQHKSTTNHLRRTHKNTLMLLHAGWIEQQSERVWCSTRMKAALQLCIFMLFLLYVTINRHVHSKMKILFCPAVFLICHCKHTRSRIQMWCSSIVWQLSLQLPWRHGAAALALKA